MKDLKDDHPGNDLIQLTELRLGNWVLMNDKPVYMDLRLFHAVANAFDGYKPYPIPLTEDILIKSGFRKNGYVGSAEKWTMDYKIVGDIECISLFKGNGHYILMDYPLSKYKYLHQLQNIYHSLTGNELKINL